MSSWEDLNRVVREQVDNHFEDLWQERHKECLLPWIFTSGFHCSFEKPNSQIDFIDHVLDVWMVKDKVKSDYIKSHFGEQLALFYLFKRKPEMSKETSRQNITQFLDDWAELPPLANNLLVNKCFQLQSLMEIDSFLNSKLIIGQREVKNNAKWGDNVNDFLNKWQSNSPSPFDSLIFWETRTKYRINFCSQLTQQATIFNETSINEKLSMVTKDIWFSLLDCALSQNNYYLAKKVVVTVQKFCQGNELWQLKKSKTKLLLAQMYDDVSIRLKTAVNAWIELEPLENKLNIDTSLKMAINCHITEICKDIFFCIQKSPEKWNELQNHHNKEKQWLLKKISSLNYDNGERVVECLYRKGLESLCNATEIAHEHYHLVATTNLERQKYDEVANTYLSLTKYCLLKDKVNDQLQRDELLIKSLLRSMSYGSVEAQQLFPCLLDLPSLSTDLKDVFETESVKVPDWMFLLWVNQLLANLDTEVGIALQPLLLKLAKTYPTALQIPFHISCTKFPSSCGETRQFVEKLRKLLSFDHVTDNLLRAFLYIRVPQIGLLNYIKEIRTSVKNDCSNDWNESKWKEMFEMSFRSSRDDCFKGRLYDENRSYKDPLENIRKKIQNGCDKEVVLDDISKLQDKISDDFNKRRRANNLFKLRDISPWLSNFNRLIGDIEIPGQYTGDSKPLQNLHIRISRFSETFRVQMSLRRPIKIGILGHDGIERGFLVKCGEDLRQDQRIQQLLKLMNKILIKDNITGRNFFIGTYSVIPLMNKLGLISWVDKTETLGKFIQSSLSPEEDLTFNSLAKSHKEKILDLLGIIKKKDREVISDGIMHIRMYLQLGQNESVGAFRERVSALSDDIFCRSVQRLSKSSVAYHYLRCQLGSSLAVMNICHWVLGIGDRHLENTLIRMTDGHLFGIDFGHAFGTATQFLPIPELMPFRLTPKILNLFSPFNETGLLRETMVQCLTSLRKCEHLLVAAMNVFIKEPSLDWLELANNQAKEVGVGEYETGSGTWFPSEKIKTAQRKLTGANPMFIMLEELKAGHEKNGQIFGKIKGVLEGGENSLRSTKPPYGLTPKEQVACLIEQAKDEHILSKTYSGWQPWI